MTITALPTPPTRSDPTNFASRADTFLAALPTFATEANALAAAMNLNATTDTSTTSNLIGTGSKTFTVSSGKSFQPGMYLMLADTAAPSTNAMIGQVTSYSGTSLVVNVKAVIGSGTKTAWTISQSVPTADMGVFTTLQATSGIDSTAIGATTPSTGKFTTLQATSGIDSTAIGATTPSTGKFTTLQSTGAATLSSALTTTVDSGAASNLLLKYNGSTVGTVSSTGLAVTGTLSASGVTSLSGDVSIKQAHTFALENTDGTNYFYAYNSGATGAGNAKLDFVKSGTGTIASLSGTGLAVTGALSTTAPITITNSSGEGQLITSTSASNYLSIKGNTGGTAQWIGIGSDTGITWVGSVSNHPVSFRINNTEKAQLDTSGNFGLGVTPSASTVPSIQSTYGILVGAQEAHVGANTYFGGSWKYKSTAAATRYYQNGGAHYWYTAASGTADTAVTFVQSLAVGKGTSLALEGATSAAGTGIEFPATQLASSSANCLDDYEEGTWTPTQGAGLTVVGAFSSSGTYTKVGRQVTVIANLTGATSIAATGGQAICAGLPFTPAADSVGSLSNGTANQGSQAIVASGTVYTVTTITAGATPIRFTLTYFV